MKIKDAYFKHQKLIHLVVTFIILTIVSFVFIYENFKKDKENEKNEISQLI